MKLFDLDARQSSEASRRLYARYELARTAVDFLAAAMFLVGSVMFFWDATQYAATWLFVLGSVCFAIKPTLKLSREMHLYRVGRLSPLAEADKAASEAPEN
ncbi:YrhK family protein [Litorisediminicola beolgyonensis]|uniref:YrhK family protein n=1 Tax=Litorisediminicola beolgyonensis TaxID=1173614 RepID=A0ABW3ZKC2_9RHOB